MEEKKDSNLITLGYPNNPGSTFANPGGLSLDDMIIVPQIGIGLAFAFRTDNQGKFKVFLMLMFFFSNRSTYVN